MNRAHWIATVAFAGIALLGANLATATTVQKFTLSDLAKKSETIVRATVEDQSARWDAGHKEIYTFITLHVLDAVKGAKGENTITIRQLGGTVDNVVSTVPGMPNFKKGEEVVVFLSNKDSAGYPWVMGLQQGKYTVTTDANGVKHVRNEIVGLQTLSPNGKVDDAKTSTEQPLQSFVDGIKTQLNVDGKIQVDPTVK